MIGSKLKQLYGRLEIHINKLFAAAVMSSFGAPVTFVFSIVISSLVNDWTGLDGFKLMSLFFLSFLVSLFFTFALTVFVFLFAKVFGMVSVNAALVSLICLVAFGFLTVIGVDFRDAPDLRMQVYALGLAAVNALIFMLLAFKQTKKYITINNIAT
jgi:hypothetical protein